MAIYNAVSDEYMHVPSTPDEWREVAKDFIDLRNFPNCVGAIDGKYCIAKATPLSLNLSQL